MEMIKDIQKLKVKVDSENNIKQKWWSVEIKMIKADKKNTVINELKAE